MPVNKCVDRKIYSYVSQQICCQKDLFLCQSTNMLLERSILMSVNKFVVRMIYSYVSQYVGCQQYIFLRQLSNIVPARYTPRSVNIYLWCQRHVFPRSVKKQVVSNISLIQSTYTYNGIYQEDIYLGQSKHMTISQKSMELRISKP